MHRFSAGEKFLSPPAPEGSLREQLQTSQQEDDNNREHQGVLAFEDSYRPRNWNLRQFGFVVGASLANAHMAYEYFVNNSEEEGVVTSKANFLPKVCEELIENKEWVAQKEAAKAPGASPSSIEEEGEMDDDADNKIPCTTKTIPAGHYKWDLVKSCFPVAGSNQNSEKNMYQKYRCQHHNAYGFACYKRVRTYCTCNPARILCGDCIILHRMKKHSCDRSGHD